MLDNNLPDIQHEKCTLTRRVSMTVRMKKDVRLEIKNLNCLSDLEQLAKKARQNITFFGHRYTRFDGYKGTVSIYKLHEKLNHLVDNYPATEDPERLIEKGHIFEVKKIIMDLYDANFNRKTNIITRICAAVLDFFWRLTAVGYEASFIIEEFRKKPKIQALTPVPQGEPDSPRSNSPAPEGNTLP